MILVVDANVIIAALIKDSTTRKILTSGKFKFVTPDFVRDEIHKYLGYVLDKAGLTKEGLDLLLALVFEDIEVIPREDYALELPKAREIMEEDLKDAPYVACYLALKCDSIWTNDPDYSDKPELRIIKTSNLMKLL